MNPMHNTAKHLIIWGPQNAKPDVIGGDNNFPRWLRFLSVFVAFRFEKMAFNAGESSDILHLLVLCHHSLCVLYSTNTLFYYSYCYSMEMLVCSGKF